MRLFILLFVISTSSVLAQLKSPFQSTVQGIDIPNTHNIDDRFSVYRGMAPGNHIGILKVRGFTDILIFKNDTRGEVEKEKKDLLARGFSPSNIYHIPFRWADFRSYINACKQVVEGLRILRNSHGNSRKKVFFHCTVGEDRTGLLAGLWRMINFGWPAKKAFQTEMCSNGYEAGNPNKPAFVVNKVRHYLTPLFKVMSYMVTSKRLHYRYLDPAVCDYFHKINYERSAKYFLREDLKCSTSSKFIRR